jgi:hypothetical protein
MIMTTKLKQLIKKSSEVITLYLGSIIDGGSVWFEVIPYYDKNEQYSEVVTIKLKSVTSVDHDFLEPLATYFIKTKTNWDFFIEDGELCISIT